MAQSDECPTVIFIAYECRHCEVSGHTDPDNPTCWNCGTKDIVVTARPSLPCRSRHCTPTYCHPTDDD